MARSRLKDTLWGLGAAVGLTCIVLALLETRWTNSWRLLIGGLGVLPLLLILIWRVPKWQAECGDGSFTTENEARKTILQVLAGSMVLAGFYFNWLSIDTARRTAQEQLKATRDQLTVAKEGGKQSADNASAALDLHERTDSRSYDLNLQTQFGDRYTKAITQLADPAIEVRLGGIYALERLAADSTNHHWTVMEVLTSYIRERARWNGENVSELIPSKHPPRSLTA